MVYCELSKVEDNYADYLIGGYHNDITGQIRVYDDGSFELKKKPDNSDVYLKHITNMIHRYLPDIREHNYKEKMAYEI